MLLAAGADKEVADQKGLTPLMWAESQEHTAVATMLREAGALE